MPQLIETPVEVAAAGSPPKIIREFVGRARTNDPTVSIAHMKSPAGWSEPGQRPKFTEYTIVLSGTLVVRDQAGTELSVQAGQATIAAPGEWVQYSSPGDDGAEYVAVCIPAFSPETVNRDQ